MAQGTYRGTYETGDPRAAAQARAMGASIGPDGWWYKDGKRLDHNQADAMANTAGVAADNAHQQWGTGDIWDRNRNFVGNALKNVAPVAAALIPGIGALAAGAIGGLGSALGAGIKHGTNVGDIAKTGVENGLLASSGNGLVSSVKGALAAAPAVAQGSSGLGVAGVDASSSLAPTLAPSPFLGANPGVSAITSAAKTLTPPPSWLDTAGKYGGQAFGFLKDNPVVAKAGFDYLSGQTQQQGDLNEAKLNEIRLGNETVELEKKRKQQMGEILASLFASGFFDKYGTKPPR